MKKVEKKTKIIKETTIMLEWSEVIVAIDSYLYDHHDIRLPLENKDTNIRVLSGKQKTPVIPVALKMYYKEEMK
jgi:hypothetical protein